ncbi:MAG: type I-C CRISPR-associated protein Cas8c/Csd1 [Clostridiales bacterium]|nr:type I-C CRISPR-associated protein Cas8c/Csd1 [Clostridiales bacterium]
MLSELAQYAQDHKLAAQPGFKPKSVKGYIHLSADGTFTGVEVLEKGADPVYAPDIGSAANGTRYCNPLVEKAKIPLCMVEDEKKDKNIPTKHTFFLSMLDSGVEYEPKFSVIAQALRDQETCDAIIAALGQHKLKGAAPIGFWVDGTPVEQTPGCAAWWSEFRQRFTDVPSSDLPRCFVTGDLAPALTTVPKVSGLLSVGGHTSGDAFLCFDKDAFQSYGLKKSANASVSEEGMTAVNAALTKLIGDAPTFGGAKLVHWYSREVPDETDLFGAMMEGFWGDEAGDEPEPAPVDAEDNGEAERSAMNRSKELIDSVHSGERVVAPLSARYYIMPVSGAGGRMMVRGWYEGSFEELYAHIDQWFADLMLVSPGGKGWTKPPKLEALCTRLIKLDGDPKKIRKSMDTLSGRLLDAIINGNPLPDEVASRALHYIRSGMLSSESKKKGDKADQTQQEKQVQKDPVRLPIEREVLAYQLLKAWLVRRQRQRGEQNIMGTDINTSPHTAAYNCGRLMAVYAAIQENAMDVNVGVVERYYSAASTTPAFVIGRLAALSQYYFSKLSEGSSIFYQKMLSELFSEIDLAQLPDSLDMRQQTEFAVGFYQQRAVIYRKRDTKESEK